VKRTFLVKAQGVGFRDGERPSVFHQLVKFENDSNLVLTPEGAVDHPEVDYVNAHRLM
jgi:hypothetical protein